MPTETSLPGTPVELTQTAEPSAPSDPSTGVSDLDKKALDFVITWRNKLKSERIEKIQVWNECWALYRGQEDFSNREDWQTKIVLPKAWGTVKSAVNTIKRLMGFSNEPWQ